VPGYIQRGGSPTEKDRRLATVMAAKAVELLYNDSDSKAIGVSAGELIEMDLVEALQVKPVFRADLYELANILGKGK